MPELHFGIWLSLGGENLDILFITTAAEGRDSEKEPHAGAIYAAKVGVKGRKEGRFILGGN